MRASPQIQLLLALLACAAAFACRSHEPAPGLLQVMAFTSGAADVGDRLELTGSGFPEGKPATLTFRGDLFRPGRAPLEDVEIVAPASSLSHSTIAVTLTEALLAEFTGRGAQAAHTTFRGEVIGAFAARTPGAPPIGGSVYGVVLDLVPPATSDAFDQDRERGQQLLGFAGIEAEQGAERVIVRALRPGGRGEVAGLKPGDELLEFDRVRVRSVADLIPSGKQRRAQLMVRRPGHDPFETALDVEGFRGSTPEDLALAALIILFFSALVLGAASRAAHALTWLERRLAANLKSVGGPQRSARARWAELTRLGLGLLPVPPVERGLSRLLVSLAVLTTTAWLTLSAFELSLLPAELELLVLGVTALSAFGVLGLLIGGQGRASGGASGRAPSGSAARWSLRAGLKNAAQVLLGQLPALAAASSVLLATGSVRVRDIVSAQGGSPWHWHAFRSPQLLLMFLLFLAAAIPHAAQAQTRLPELDRRPQRIGGPAPLSPLSYFAEWTTLLIASSLGALLFLGGYRLPLLSASAQQASLLYQLLGSALLVCKAWVLLGALLTLRSLVPELRMDQLAGLWARWLLPAACFGFATTLAWVYGLRSPSLRQLEPGLGAVVFGTVAFLLGYLGRRVSDGIRRPEPHTGMNPWL